MQNIEKQVRQIFKILEKTGGYQIKDKCQLAKGLAKGVAFITQKFDEYEKDRRGKDAVIATLPSELKSASMKVEYLQKKVDRQKQYSRRKLYFNSWIERRKDKSIDDRVLKLFREELNEDVSLVDLDRTHRIGKKRDSNSKPHPVIVKFARYNIHENILKKKTEGKKYYHYRKSYWVPNEYFK